VWCRNKRLAAVVAAVCACAVPGIRAQEPELFELRVHLRIDPVIPSRVNTAGLKDETEQLWRPYGVQIAWTDTCAGDPAVRGLCVKATLAQRIEEPDRPHGATVLGLAFAGSGGPGPRLVLVSVDATASALARRRASWSSIAPIVPERELTRALGRVLAHEIGHVFLDMWSHDERGLMRATYDPRELADRNRVPFRLTAGALARLRSRLCVPGNSRPSSEVR
jgi:hypothetical protein